MLPASFLCSAASLLAFCFSCFASLCFALLCCWLCFCRSLRPCHTFAFVVAFLSLCRALRQALRGNVEQQETTEANKRQEEANGRQRQQPEDFSDSVLGKRAGAGSKQQREATGSNGCCKAAFQAARAPPKQTEESKDPQRCVNLFGPPPKNRGQNFAAP